jgi:hypothetical protein
VEGGPAKGGAGRNEVLRAPILDLQGDRPTASEKGSNIDRLLRRPGGTLAGESQFLGAREGDIQVSFRSLNGHSAVVDRLKVATDAVPISQLGQVGFGRGRLGVFIFEKTIPFADFDIFDFHGPLPLVNESNRTAFPCEFRRVDPLANQLPIDQQRDTVAGLARADVNMRAVFLAERQQRSLAQITNWIVARDGQKVCRKCI